MNRALTTIGIVTACLLLAPFVVSVFVPWSDINCQHQEINIKTGQVRYSRSYWYVTVSERIEDTPLSRVLQGETVDVADIEAWQRVNTFSPGVRHSPHYRFHSALPQANLMAMVGPLLDVTPQRKKEIAREILTAWQQSGCDSGAGDLLQNLTEEAISNVSSDHD